ncbi:antibiotic biosynthesis monooxygenase family protein [Amycolatopsis keratiniphila]|uniref:antibiotic biosynthesis monooxygenase family protein n=2 Tax=Amycolatopsis keratiniphila TaxID=129921 RepID=UPI0005C1991E|nr:antibiotic biosynthesis monooxygenase [Amycolatopsis keratiniphila]
MTTGTTTTVELTRFKVPADRADELLQARPAMVADFRADREGFLDAQLIRVDEETWLDVVWWRSSEDFAASREKGANLPGIKAFFAPIAELVSAEEGVTGDHIPGQEISPPPVR